MQTRVKQLSKSELKKAQKTFSEWSFNPKATALSRSFTFSDHVDALVFIARVTVHAQVLAHHPDILFTFKKVKVTLSTHDCDGISSQDLELAKRIEKIVHN